MNRRKKVMAMAAGLIAAGACAVGMGTTPAHAAPAAATAWRQAFIFSQRSNGTQCAFWSADNHLAPIDSVICTIDTWWWCRILNNSTWNVQGDHYECVDKNKTFMFGESGGAFKMETPNSNDYIQEGANFPSGWAPMEYIPNDNYFGSGPAGTPLGVETTESDGHGWLFGFLPQ
jgi:hypothetical protein